MADTVTDQKEILEINSSADDGHGTVTVIRAVDKPDATDVGVSDEYIFQQTFGEVTDALQAADEAIQIQYTTDDGVELQEGDIIDTPNGPVRLISNGTLVTPEDDQTSENYNNNGFQVVATASGEDIYVQEETAEAVHVDGHMGNQLTVIPQNTIVQNAVPIESGMPSKDTQMQPQQMVSSQMANLKPVLAANTAPDGAPLGSSQNPIRIIQQGNQYIPVQQLSTDQLQQIMQVVQQQQLTKQSTDLGSSVLFNPQTNTRIVYRVIYPSELHKDDDSKSKEQDNVTQQDAGQAPQKRPYKRKAKEDEEEKIDAPELTKEEKEARKKLKQKTRSGRVSKPPKHMVKDFKHIHVLDYDEDYDDSDGGYSDFKQSDAEDDDESSRSSSKKDDDGNYLMPGISSSKPKNWKCNYCEKAYVGRAGLARHLRLNPDHGNLEPGSEDMVATPTDADADTSNDMGNTSVTPTSGTVNGMAAPVNGVNSAASLSEDSRDSSSSISFTPRPRGRGFRGRPPWKGRGRGRGSRGSYNVDPDLRRRNKLKEIVRDSLDEELMEIVLPRLTKVITLWEFLLMKVEKGTPTKPHADDIYREYMKLHDQVKRLCQEYLECIPTKEDPQLDSSVIRVEESTAAESLGLTAGLYKVKEISDDDSSFDYKLITTNKRVYNDYHNKSSLKRTVEVVSPQEMITPSKKSKIVEDVKSKIMPVSFSDKLKSLIPSSVSPVQNVSGQAKSAPLGKIIVVSQPSQLGVSQTTQPLVSQSSMATVLLNNATGVTEAKPVVYYGANDLKSQQPVSIVAGHVTPNNVQLVSAINQVDVARTNLPVPKPTTMVCNNSLLKPAPKPVAVVPNNSLLKPTVGTPVTVLNQPQAHPVSLLKQSGVLPATTPQKFIIMSGTNSSDVKSLNMGEVQHTTRKPKEIVLDTGPHLSLPYVNTSSQAPQSLISSQTSSNISVHTLNTNSSSLLPSTFIPPIGSSESVPLLNSGVYTNGSSQEPVSYIAIPISQQSQPQMSVPSFSNNLPGTIVLQPAVNSNSSSVPPGQANTTNLLSAIVSSAKIPTDQSNMLKIVNATSDANQTSYQVIAEHPGTVANSVILDNNHIVETSAMKSESHAVIIGSGQLGNSQEVDQNLDLQVKSETEQSVQILHLNQQNDIGGMTTSEPNIDTSENLEQTDQSDRVIDVSLTSNSENIGVINSVDASGSQIQTSDTDISVLVNGENGLPAESESVQMEPVSDNNNQEETIQIPASNIFQTEDGLIFIQNADGTTLQLQGSDGQSIPLETIQALLSMDGETQLITE